MSKTYKAVSVVIGIRGKHGHYYRVPDDDLTAVVQEEATEGWTVHTFAVLPPTENECAQILLLLERDNHEG